MGCSSLGGSHEPFDGNGTRERRCEISLWLIWPEEVSEEKASPIFIRPTSAGTLTSRPALVVFCCPRSLKPHGHPARRRTGHLCVDGRAEACPERRQPEAQNGARRDRRACEPSIERSPLPQG